MVISACNLDFTSIKCKDNMIKYSALAFRMSLYCLYKIFYCKIFLCCFVLVFVGI
jgi:hypothetical protein